MYVPVKSKQCGWFIGKTEDNVTTVLDKMEIEQACSILNTSLEELSGAIHRSSVEKGFWNNNNTGEKLMLIVTQLGDALEAHQKNYFTKVSMVNVLQMDDAQFVKFFTVHVKDTFEDELADTFIRLFDLAEHYRINLLNHAKAKHRFNTSDQSLFGKLF